MRISTLRLNSEYTLLGLMTRTRPKLPMVVVSDSLDGMAGR